MRAVIQRVNVATLYIDDKEYSRIGAGMVILLAVHKDDIPETAARLAKKISKLRIFQDSRGRMNRSMSDISGEVLVVSQFTLYGDCSRGNRPSFIESAGTDKAALLYENFIDRLRENGLPVKTGRFGAAMRVSLENDGPVTLILDY